MTDTFTPITFHPSSFLNKSSVRSIELFKNNIDNAGRLPIMEIFKAYEGEGSKIGTPRVLVRLGGCPVMCKNCDTIHSFNVNKKLMRYQSLEVIVARVLEVAANSKGNIGVREVSITGGEPMMYPEMITQLAKLLKDKGFKLSLETSGMVIDETVFSNFDFISLDIKTPSTGVMVTQEQIDLIYKVRSHHFGTQVKVVISDDADLAWVKNHMADFLSPYSQALPLILTPNSPYMKEGQQAPSVYAALMDMIIDWNDGYNIVVIPQIHKLLQLDPFPEYLDKK